MKLTSKRISDNIFSLFGLVVFAPLFIIIALLIKITSEGPVIFKQKRIGQYGKLFTIYKFRTMKVNNDKNTISVKGDSRITAIGRILRKYKLDELPELWNVFIGDMSFVGPRPDVPIYTEYFAGENRKVLNLKPGITGPATLKYSNEEELLAKVEDPIKYNNEIIFPDKIRINLDYMENQSFCLDIKIMWQTLFRSNY
jgi:lipopolysaccharide/colanic/teichoic acid biosynthesis glycosyltransferase